MYQCRKKAWILGACLTLLPMLSQASAVIEVQGTGHVKATPDQAELTLTVSETADSVAAAKQVVDSRLAKLLAVAKQYHIDKQHRDASTIVSMPEYEWQDNKREYKGETVRRELQLTVTDLQQLSPLLQALTHAAPMRLSQPQYTFSQLTALQHKALANAVKDAHDKAEVLATAAHVQLGDIERLTASGGSSPQPRMLSMKVASAANESAPVEVGPQQIEQRVSLSYAIEQ